MPPQPPITILGAGIGGLTLGQCLRRRGIPSILYEKASASAKRHSYGITLHLRSIAALSDLLDLDVHTFRQRTAASRLYHDGLRKTQPAKSEDSSQDPPPHFRVNRARLEKLLSQGLDIKYDHPIDRTTHISELTKPSSLVVDTLGVHSYLRLSALPGLTPTVLPYVVFSGRRCEPLAVYEKIYAQHFRESGSTCSVFHPDARGNKSVRLEISVDDINPSAPPLPGYTPPTAGEVVLRYTYSRPARSNSTDPLHNPTRSNDSASTIPDELYAELASLGDCPRPFQSAFSHRGDRVLHWLMRTLMTSRADLSSLSSSAIVLIGDSAHATPILGGNGANNAIRDALELAAAISSSDMTSIPPQGGSGDVNDIPGKGRPADGTAAERGWETIIESFYDKLYPRWACEVAESEMTIAAMHEKDGGTSKGKSEKAGL